MHGDCNDGNWQGGQKCFNVIIQQCCYLYNHGDADGEAADKERQ